MVAFNVQINKDELLIIVENNAKRHKQIYEEAKVGFLKKVGEKLQQAVEDLVNNDGTKGVYINECAPPSHMKEYDLAISMLRNTTDTSITLTPSDFNTLVRDMWDWQSSFLTHASQYSSSASGCMTTLYG